jgi:uncharacterized protein YjaG (DUF416 family)
LPLYAFFVERHRWGDFDLLRQTLNLAWQALANHTEVIAASVTPLPNLLEKLGEITPHGDDFPSPDSTYAQDAVICVDAAVRGLTGDVSLDGAWIEYALEASRTKVTSRMTGYTALEGDLARDWEETIFDDPEVAALLADYQRLIEKLKLPTSRVDIEDIRREGYDKRLRPDDYFDFEARD